MNAIPGMSCVAPRSAFYAMPKVALPPGKTDVDYVLGLLQIEGGAVRIRLGLRHRTRGRLLPHRVSRIAERARCDLRRCRRLHQQSSDPRSLIRYAVLCFAIALIVLLWTLYLVRGPLLLIYVSALFATGLAPLVRWIERRGWSPSSRRRVPRAVAILVDLRDRARHHRRHCRRRDSADGPAVAAVLEGAAGVNRSGAADAGLVGLDLCRTRPSRICCSSRRSAAAMRSRAADHRCVDSSAGCSGSSDPAADLLSAGGLAGHLPFLRPPVPARAPAQGRVE